MRDAITVKGKNSGRDYVGALFNYKSAICDQPLFVSPKKQRAAKRIGTKDNNKCISCL